MIRRAPLRSENRQEQIQGSEQTENGTNGNVSMASSENNGFGKSSRRDLQSLHKLSADVSHIIHAADFTANFQLDFFEMAMEDMAKKIKKEANSHCEKVKEIALQEIITNKRPSSEILKEYFEMVSKILENMEDKIKKLYPHQRANVVLVDGRALREVIDTVEKAIEPSENMLFGPKNVRKLLSLCRKAVTTLHSLMSAIVLYVAFTYACRAYNAS